MFKVEIILPPELKIDNSLVFLAAKKSLTSGMYKVERTSKKDYLTGPRPLKLGVVTGRLRNSIKTRVLGGSNSLSGEVGTNVFYGKFHEEGLGSKPKRAFLSTAINDEIKGIEKDIITSIEDALGDAIT